ncbi:MAG: hypothetical protein IMX05_07895 [Hydrogenibacillus schlegelii]|nr:hypothetical protein [Hydrogenibacillus schlegelii]
MAKAFAAAESGAPQPVTRYESGSRFFAFAVVIYVLLVIILRVGLLGPVA